MKNIIIIPAYNESGNIENTIKDIKQNSKGFDYIIVNDCSTDNTLEICRENHFNYLNLPINLGIGGAVQAGYRYAYYHGYDTAVQFDGDGQHDASYLSALLEVLEKDEADMAIGSRFIENEGFQSSAMRRMGIKFFTRLIKILTGKRITDPTSGMRMVNRKLIKEFTFSYPKDYPEPESVVTVMCRGYRAKEVPVKMRSRSEGESSISMSKSVYYMIKVSISIIICRLSYRRKARV